MSVKQDIICRLCFKVPDFEFQVIDDVTKEMLDVLALKMNFDVSNDPIICRDCLEILQKCFNFKSACIDTEESILSLSDEENKIKIDLDDAHVAGKDEYYSLCRFCLRETRNYISIDALTDHVIFSEMLPAYMPEMDLNIAEDSVICTRCTENLELYFRFALSCVDVEHKINAYCKEKGTNSFGRVELKSILQFLFKDILQCPSECTRVPKIKSEPVTMGDADDTHFNVYEKLKTEEDLHIKDEESLSDNEFRRRENRSTSENAPKIKNHKCTKCPYETKRLNHLKKHTLTHEATFKCTMCTYATKRQILLEKHLAHHKNPSEAEVYRCARCDYETRLKKHLRAHEKEHSYRSEGKTYQCETCPYTSEHKKNLKHHMLVKHGINVGVKLLRCAVCSFTTHRKRDMDLHDRRYHKNASELDDVLLKCANCTYETLRKDCLISHVRCCYPQGPDARRRIFECSMCTYKAPQKRYLNEHMRRRHRKATT